MATNLSQPGPAGRQAQIIGRTTSGEHVLLEPAWQRFLLQTLVSRIGGDTAMSNDELEAALDVLGADIGTAPVHQEHVLVEALEAEVSELRAAVAELRREIQGMNEGPML